MCTRMNAVLLCLDRFYISVISRPLQMFHLLYCDSTSCLILQWKYMQGHFQNKPLPLCNNKTFMHITQNEIKRQDTSEKTMSALMLHLNGHAPLVLK